MVSGNEKKAEKELELFAKNIINDIHSMNPPKNK